MTPHTQSTRWASEAAFFDAAASTIAAEPVQRAIVDRYRNPAGDTALEYQFRAIGDVRNKQVLDVGCGMGDDSILLALLGARVTGVDLSAGSLEVARARAEVNGVQATFLCSPFESVQVAAQYDVVWVDAFLHHVISDLEPVLAKIVAAVAPGGLVVCKEPLAMSALLRGVRNRLSWLIPKNGTPDERPLEPAELRIVRSMLPGAKFTFFTGPLNRIVDRYNRTLFEDMPISKQNRTRALWRFENAIVRSVPAMAVEAVIEWRKPR